MAPQTSQAAESEFKFARFDIENVFDATFWAHEEEIDIEWNSDESMMVVGLDNKGKVAFWNDRAEELTGFEKREVLGSSFARHLMSSAFVGFVECVLQRTWRGEDVGCFQIPFFTKSGVKLRLVVSSSRSSSGSSQLILFKMLTMDDVARQRAARGNAVMTVHTDVDGQVKELDVGACELSEFGAAEMVGKDFMSAVGAHDRDALEHAFMQSIMCKKLCLPSAIPLHKKDGTKTWWMLHSIPKYAVRQHQITGRLAGVVFVATLIGEPLLKENDPLAKDQELPRFSS